MLGLRGVTRRVAVKTSGEKLAAVAGDPCRKPRHGDVAPLGTVAKDAHLANDKGDDNVFQQLTRWRAGHQEFVRGRLRVGFVPGQRLATVHAGFCPPLSSVPKIEILQADGPATTIKASQVLPYGVGFDVRLVEIPSTDETVEILFTAIVAIV
jgi:hypothetical protein